MLRELLPIDILKSMSTQDWKREIVKAYNQDSGMSPEDAKIAFLKVILIYILSDKIINLKHTKTLHYFPFLINFLPILFNACGKGNFFPSLLNTFTKGNFFPILSNTYGKGNFFPILLNTYGKGNFFPILFKYLWERQFLFYFI